MDHVQKKIIYRIVAVVAAPDIVKHIAAGEWTASDVLEAYISRAALAQEKVNCLTEGTSNGLPLPAPFHRHIPFYPRTHADLCLSSHLPTIGTMINTTSVDPGQLWTIDCSEQSSSWKPANKLKLLMNIRGPQKSLRVRSMESLSVSRMFVSFVSYLYNVEM